MALAHFHYVQSTDVGAPQLSGTNLAGNDVMYHILVTVGGWTREYHDAASNQSVFRMRGGSLQYLYIAHNATITGSRQRFVFRAAEGASDYDTLVDPYPQVGDVSDANCSVLASSNSNSDTRKWEALVWESGVIFIVHPNTAATSEVTVFCDCVPSDPADSYATLVTTRNSAANWGPEGTLNSQTLDTNVYTPSLTWRRSLDGSEKATRGALYQNQQSSNETGVPSTGNRGDWKIPHRSIMVTCNGSRTAGNNDQKARKGRAYLPQIRHLMTSGGVGSLTADDTLGDSAYSAGSVLRLLAMLEVTQAYLLETTNTWKP